MIILIYLILFAIDGSLCLYGGATSGNWYPYIFLVVLTGLSIIILSLYTINNTIKNLNNGGIQNENKQRKS